MLLNKVFILRLHNFCDSTTQPRTRPQRRICPLPSVIKSLGLQLQYHGIMHNQSSRGVPHEYPYSVSSVTNTVLTLSQHKLYLRLFSQHNRLLCNSSWTDGADSKLIHPLASNKDQKTVSRGFTLTCRSFTLTFYQNDPILQNSL